MHISKQDKNKKSEQELTMQNKKEDQNQTKSSPLPPRAAESKHHEKKPETNF